MNVDSINGTNSDLGTSVSSILTTLNEILTDPLFSVTKTLIMEI